MFIVKMRKGEFRFPLWLSRQPILCLWLCSTCRPPDYQRYTTYNGGRSIDAHFQDLVGCVTMFFLSMKAANRSKTHCEVPMSIFQNQQSHIWMRPYMSNLICRTVDWNWWAQPYVANHVGWWVWVWAWPVWSHRVGIWVRSGTEPTSFCGLNTDCKQVTPPRCVH